MIGLNKALTEDEIRKKIKSWEKWAYRIKISSLINQNIIISLIKFWVQVFGNNLLKHHKVDANKSFKQFFISKKS